MQKVNRQVVVKERPRFLIPTTNCFRMDSGPIPVPAAGQVLIRTLWLGMDPYLFSRIQQVSERSKPIPLGEVMYGATVGRVEISNHPDYAVGDLVSGLWGWQDYAVSDGRGIAKIDKTLSRPSYMLGAMGAAGFGAWLAVAKVLNVQAGETLTFGAALGGMGQIAGQIGKIRGARVVGVAGNAALRSNNSSSTRVSIVRRPISPRNSRRRFRPGLMLSSSISAAKCSTPRCRG